MALTATEQSYFDTAKRSLPRFLFQLSTSPQEMLGAFAKTTGAFHTQIGEWLDYTFLGSATGVWLDQHAKDRGTTRRNGETDDVLLTRLRNTEDVVTRPALLAGVNQLLTTAGFPATATMVELRRDMAHWQGTGVGESVAFYSRGYRYGSGARPHGFVVMLPYDTDEATAAAVDEYLRKAKAAGYAHHVERRTIP